VLLDSEAMICQTNGKAMMTAPIVRMT